MWVWVMARITETETTVKGLRNLNPIQAEVYDLLGLHRIEARLIDKIVDVIHRALI